MPLSRGCYSASRYSIVPRSDTHRGLSPSHPPGSRPLPQQEERRAGKFLLPAGMRSSRFPTKPQRFTAVRAESHRNHLLCSFEQALSYCGGGIAKAAFFVCCCCYSTWEFWTARAATVEMDRRWLGEEGKEGLSVSSEAVLGGIVRMGIVFIGQFAGGSQVRQKGTTGTEAVTSIRRELPHIASHQRMRGLAQRPRWQLRIKTEIFGTVERVGSLRGHRGDNNDQKQRIPPGNRSQSGRTTRTPRYRPGRKLIPGNPG